MNGVENALSQRDLKKNLIDLSTKYNVMSKWTSFIAVDDEEKVKTGEKAKIWELETILCSEKVDDLSYIQSI